MALDARKFDVSENYNHKRTNRNKQHMRENLTARIFLIGLDARKFSCAKISTFTVVQVSVLPISISSICIHMYREEWPTTSRLVSRTMFLSS